MYNDNIHDEDYNRVKFVCLHSYSLNELVCNFNLFTFVFILMAVSMETRTC